MKYLLILLLLAACRPQYNPPNCESDVDKACPYPQTHRLTLDEHLKRLQCIEETIDCGYRQLEYMLEYYK